MPQRVKNDHANPAEEAVDVIKRRSVVKKQHCPKTEEAQYEAEAEAEFGYKNDEEAFDGQERLWPKKLSQIFEEEERYEPNEEQERHQSKTLSQLFAEESRYEVYNYDQDRPLAPTKLRLKLERSKKETLVAFRQHMLGQATLR